MNPEISKKYFKDAARTATHSEGFYARVHRITFSQGEQTFTMDSIDSQDFIHGVLGMAGESAEAAEVLTRYFDGKGPENSCYNEDLVLKEDVRKEVGDFMWYATRAAVGMHEEFAGLLDAAIETEEQLGSLKLVEMLKKWFFYGKPINIETAKELWKASVGEMKSLVRTDEVMELIFKENIEKLRKRYPEKFTEEDAIARVDA